MINLFDFLNYLFDCNNNNNNNNNKKWPASKTFVFFLPVQILVSRGRAKNTFVLWTFHC